MFLISSVKNNECGILDDGHLRSGRQSNKKTKWNLGFKWRLLQFPGLCFKWWVYKCLLPCKKITKYFFKSYNRSMLGMCYESHL